MLFQYSFCLHKLAYSYLRKFDLAHGVHLVGSYASEIIMTATMMVDTELTPNRLQKLVFPHPTVAEIIREAIFHI